MILSETVPICEFAERTQLGADAVIVLGAGSATAKSHGDVTVVQTQEVKDYWN
jgi:hypothetical protein